jgi:hypothetical protein
MNIKLLKKIRKSLEYYWQDGYLIVLIHKNKSTRTFNTVHGFLDWWLSGYKYNLRQTYIYKQAEREGIKDYYRARDKKKTFLLTRKINYDPMHL